mgnify:CR=1 FL=1
MGTHGRLHDMDDDVADVHEHPFAGVLALGRDDLAAGFLDPFGAVGFFVFFSSPSSALLVRFFAEPFPFDSSASPSAFAGEAFFAFAGDAATCFPPRSSSNSALTFRWSSLLRSWNPVTFSTEPRASTMLCATLAVAHSGKCLDGDEQTE